MSTPTTPTSFSSNEELADLFSRLTQVRPRLSSDISKSQSKRFSLPVQPREPKQARPRRNTVASVLGRDEPNLVTDASTLEDEDDSTDLDSLASFSRAESKKFPFEFKLPIHKLYPKAEWFQTVLDTIEDSKDRFKPLAETVVYAGVKKQKDPQDTEAVRSDRGVVRFKLTPVPPIPRRRRTSATVGPHQGPDSPGYGSPPKRTTLYRSPMPSLLNLSSLKSSDKGASPTSPVDDDGTRVLKKRCVGRDKHRPPTVAPASEVARADTTPRGTWIYNAAVSACESPTTANFITFPLAPPPSPASHAEGGGVPSGGAVSGHKRRVSESIPLMKTGYTLTPMGQMPASSRLATGRSGLVADVDGGGCEMLAIQPMTRVMA